MSFELVAGLVVIAILAGGAFIYFIRKGAAEKVYRKHAEKSAERAQDATEIDEEVARLDESDLDDKLRKRR